MAEEKQNIETPEPKAASKLLNRIGRKRAIVGAVLLAVAIVGGVGMYQWHETPQFCAAFCHNMDQYLDTYEQEQGSAGTDKYGNQVANTNAMMATLHSTTKTTAKPEIGCMDCHQPVIAEQASEGANWLVGNYLDPLDERSGKELTHWRGVEANTFCANENCHVYVLGDDGKVDYNKLEAITRELEFNPHAQQHEALTLDCASCHKGHRASTVVCTGCHEHENVDLPDGWVSYDDSQQILEEAFS